MYLKKIDLRLASRKWHGVMIKEMYAWLEIKSARIRTLYAKK